MTFMEWTYMILGMAAGTICFVGGIVAVLAIFGYALFSLESFAMDGRGDERNRMDW